VPKKKIEDTETTTRTFFRMDTRVFTKIWLGHLKDGKDWTSFCVTCFERFTDLSDSNGQSNVDHLLADGGEAPEFYDAEARYLFMNDRCYQKCRTLKRAMEEEAEDGFKVMLPKGVGDRNGPAKRWQASDGLSEFRKRQAYIKD